MRLPLAFTIQSRDGSLSKDSKIANGYVEGQGESTSVFRRPGTLLAYSGAGVGRGMVCWKGAFFTVVDNTLTQGPTQFQVADGSLWSSLATSLGAALSPTNSSGRGAVFYGSSILIVSNRGTSVQGVRSDDGGATWTAFTVSGLPFSASTVSYALVYHLGELYCVYQVNSATNAACYKSVDDGATWSLLAASIGSQNGYATSLVSDGVKIYTIGGRGAVGETQAVYSSADGVSWSSVNLTALNTARSRIGAVYFANKLWAIGGNDSGGTRYDNVESSSNGGSTWTNETLAPGWAGRYATACVFVYDSKIWIIGEYDLGVTGRKDAWSSSDGVTWAQANADIGHFSSIAGVVTVSGEERIVSVQMDDGGSATQSVRQATNNTAGGDAYTITGATIPVSFTQTSGAATTEYLFLKTTAAAWVLTFGTPGTLTAINDVDYPAATVPGAVYLDGYVFVMNTIGEIYNSGLEDPTSWSALEFISAEIEPDEPVALAKHQNYLVALKSTTTELFYNAANATGSPLARMQNTALQIGCGAGYSVANVDGAMFFISRTRSVGLSVHYFPAESLTPLEVATPHIQRVLSSADLTTVHCFAGKIGGNTFYVVNLVSDGITLAYSLQSNTWAQWTYLTAQASKSVTALTQADGIATATVTSHGYSDGDPVLIAGANQSGYNGTVNITYISANSFSYPVAAGTVSPATGTITAVGYTDGYFPFGYFTSCGQFDFIQHETTGAVHKIGVDYSDDNGVPINMVIRSSPLDNGTSDKKVMPPMTIVADESNNDVLIRHTDDDYDTYSKFRRVNLGTNKPQLRRNGNYRRRAIEFRCTTANKIRLFGVDIG